jgi:hypothetical protein
MPKNFRTKDLRKLHQACRDVIQAAKGSPRNHNLQYASSYAQLCIELLDPEEIQTQVLYVLNNLTNWRGTQATATKSALKEYT